MKKKIAILGCENSHANSFLKFVIKDKSYDDVEFVGVYSDDIAAAKKLSDEFGVRVMDSFDELVGRVDGIIVTARHGDNHYKYAKPYIKSGIPMFIDKPITLSEQDAISLMREFKQNGVRFAGGSCCVFSPLVQELKKAVENKTDGAIYGGFLRAPVSLDNAYGGFFFYAQHLAEVVCEIFGYFPKSVFAVKRGAAVNVTVTYEDHSVALQFVDGNYSYYAYVSAEKGVLGGEYKVEDYNFRTEFAHYHDVLTGGESQKPAREFIAPVFVLNAIYRSMNSGREERVLAVEEI